MIEEFKTGQEIIISKLIQRCIKDVNSQHLNDFQINYLLSLYSPDGILDESSKGKIYVLTKNKKVIGTITLSGNQIASVFIDVDEQGKGYGKILLSFVEEKIKKKYIELGFFKYYLYKSCYLRSSDYAKEFYLKCGYTQGKTSYFKTMGNLTQMKKKF